MVLTGRIDQTSLIMVLIVLQMQPKSEALSESSKLLLRTRRGLVADTGKANVTAAERLLALNLHNKLRGKVSPSAADMTFMVMSTPEEGDYCDKM